MKKKKLDDTEEEKILNIPHKGSLELDSIMEEGLKERALSTVLEEITLARSKSMNQEVFALADFNAEFLIERGIIKEMLVAGEYEKAEEYIKGKFPDLWTNEVNIRTSIWGLEFIELLKKGEQKKAIEFATEHFNEAIEGSHFVAFDPAGYEELLAVDDLFGLLCYDKIEESKVKYLLLPIQREAVSDYIGKRILEAKGIKDTTTIETTLKQLIVTQNYMMERQNINSTFQLKV